MEPDAFLGTHWSDFRETVEGTGPSRSKSGHYLQYGTALSLNNDNFKSSKGDISKLRELPPV